MFFSLILFSFFSIFNHLCLHFIFHPSSFITSILLWLGLRVSHDFQDEVQFFNLFLELCQLFLQLLILACQLLILACQVFNLAFQIFNILACQLFILRFQLFAVGGKLRHFDVKLHDINMR
jgi:hypothetical protein